MSTLKTYQSKTSNKLFRFVPEAIMFWYQDTDTTKYRCSVCRDSFGDKSLIVEHYAIKHQDITQEYTMITKPFLKMLITDLFTELGTEFLRAVSDDSSKSDPVNHPSHYTFGKYEVLPVLMDWFPDQSLLWQVVKYLSRAKHKGAYLQDLKKAEFYLKRAIENAENETSNSN